MRQTYVNKVWHPQGEDEYVKLSTPNDQLEYGSKSIFIEVYGGYENEPKNKQTIILSTEAAKSLLAMLQKMFY